MDKAGDTIEDLESEQNQPKKEAVVKAWLRDRISELEAARAAQTPSKVD